MERHNYVAKYQQRAKIVTWAYIIAAVSVIIRLPLQGAIPWDFQLPLRIVLAVLAIIGLGLFAACYLKNEDACEASETQSYNFIFPALVAVASFVYFLTQGKGGDIIYCGGLGVAAYFLNEMNKIIIEINKGNR